MGGGFFQFFTTNRPQKHQKRAILNASQDNGGARAPPPPPLATLLHITYPNSVKLSLFLEIHAMTTTSGFPKFFKRDKILYLLNNL